jgi:hypothetical protein
MFAVVPRDSDSYPGLPLIPLLRGLEKCWPTPDVVLGRELRVVELEGSGIMAKLEK